MGFGRTIRRGNWGAVGLLAVVATLAACTVTTQTPLSPSDTSPSATPPTQQMRPLSSTERTALAKALSATVPNPGAAQFKWLPVATNGTGPIGYCGLINVKN